MEPKTGKIGGRLKYDSQAGAGQSGGGKVVLTFYENVKVKEAKRKEPKAKRKSSSASADAGGDLSLPEWMDL